MKKLILLFIILTLGFCKTSKEERISGSTPNFGKPTGPIQLKWDGPKNLSAGQTGDVNFEAIPDKNCEKMVISFSVLEGLEIESKDKVFTSGPKNAGESFKGTIKVKSISGGVGLLNYQGLITVSGEESGTITSISINQETMKNQKPSGDGSGYSDGKAKTTIIQ